MDQYVYSNKGAAPSVFHDQQWTPLDEWNGNVRAWISPDKVWVKIQQTMQWEGARGVWPIAQQRMDRIARNYVGGARIHNDTLSDNTIHAVWTRTYRVQ